MTRSYPTGRHDTPQFRRSSWLETAIAALACLIILMVIAVACPAGAGPDDAVGSISGSVLRDDTGESLAGAEVRLQAIDVRTTTDFEGRFMVGGLPAGSYSLVVSHPHCSSSTLENIVVVPPRTTTVEVRLRTIVFTSEVVVTPSSYSLFREQPEVRTSLNRDAVNRLPHLADDPFRAIARLPGAIGEEASAQLNVRGGEVNEVLLIVDGLEIYDGFHAKNLFGMFSIIDAEVIGGLDMMTGGFPAEYGNRMSGVIDISSSTALPTGRTSIGLSLTNLGVLGEGTFDAGQGTWLVAVRRTYLDLVLEWVDSDTGLEPVFYDVFAKVQYQIEQSSMLSVNLLGAHDDVRYTDDDEGGTGIDEELDLASSSAHVWFTTKTAWTPLLYSQTLLSYSKVVHQRQGFVATWPTTGGIDEERGFEVVGLRQDWTYGGRGRHGLRWGLDVRRFEADYDYVARAVIRDPLFSGGSPRMIDRDHDLQPTGNLYGVYVADRIRLAEDLVAEVGARWDRQTWADDDQLSPRLNLAFSPGPRTVLRAAWGRYHQPQYIHELQVEDGITEFSLAQRCEHSLLGVEHGFASGLNLRLEAYHKRLSRLRPHFENMIQPIEILPEIEPDRILVAPQRAVAAGVEVMLKHNRGGPFSWWLSYAWAEAEDRIGGEWVPRSWDQTHTVNLSLNYRRGERWNFNLAGIYHTGWPTTALEAELRTTPSGEQFVAAWFGPRNAERYDDYVRFDLRASRNWRLSAGVASLFVEIINLFDRKNIGRVDSYSFIAQPDGSLAIIEEEEHIFSMIPTFGLRWTF